MSGELHNRDSLGCFLRTITSVDMKPQNKSVNKKQKEGVARSVNPFIQPAASTAATASTAAVKENKCTNLS